MKLEIFLCIMCNSADQHRRFALNLSSFQMMCCGNQRSIQIVKMTCTLDSFVMNLGDLMSVWGKMQNT